ncbi:MAG: hypothetical protein Q3993_08560 [Filifactor alocis]|nr:hypothetical protein [Filifactor alocis]
MSKKKIRIILFILLTVLLIPVRLRYKDGGSVRYRAGLYDVTRYHQLDSTSETGYRDGWKVKILGITIFDNFDR